MKIDQYDLRPDDLEELLVIMFEPVPEPLPEPLPEPDIVAKSMGEL